MYHRVADVAEDRNNLCVPPSIFRRQMMQLRECGYAVLPLRDLADAVRNDSLPDRCVAITFDDGYLDSLTDAAPVLAELELPATFFVVSDTLDETGEFWWDTLGRVFLGAHSLPETLEWDFSDGSRQLPTTTHEDRCAAHDAVRSTFYPLLKEARTQRVFRLLEWSQVDPGPVSNVRPMTPQEVRELDAIHGLDVGAHSVSHLLLPTQPDAVKEYEISASKLRLESLLSREVDSFSYPYGGFDSRSVTAAQGAGFRLAVSTGNLRVSPGVSPYVLPRCGIRAGDDLAHRLEEIFGE